MVGAYFGVLNAKKKNQFNLPRATTHSDLVLRALNAGIQYHVVHNASIMNAVGCCGLQVRIKLQSNVVILQIFVGEIQSIAINETGNVFAHRFRNWL